MVKPSSPEQNDQSKPETHSLKLQRFKGIQKRKWGKWVSKIRMPNSTGRIWLSSYDTPAKATHAYDFAMYFLRGSKGKLNFPQSPSKIPCASSLSPLQIQGVAAKFAIEEFQLPSEDNATSSSSGSETECSNGAYKIPTFWDSILLECL